MARRCRSTSRPALVDFHIDKEALDEAFAEMAEEEGLDDEETGARRQAARRGR